MAKKVISGYDVRIGIYPLSVLFPETWVSWSPRIYCVSFCLAFAWEFPVIRGVHTGVGSFLAMNLHDIAAQAARVGHLASLR